MWDIRNVDNQVENYESISIPYDSLLPGSLKQEACHSNFASIIEELKPFISNFKMSGSTSGKLHKSQTAGSGVFYPDTTEPSNTAILGPRSLIKTKLW